MSSDQTTEYRLNELISDIFDEGDSFQYVPQTVPTLPMKSTEIDDVTDSECGKEFLSASDILKDMQKKIIMKKQTNSTSFAVTFFNAAYVLCGAKHLTH